MIKISKKIAILLLVLLVICLILEVSIIIFENTHPRLDRADAIVVLGSANAAAAHERALEGLKIYGEGKAPLMILSGGQTDLATTEAAYMASVIRQASSSPKISLEDRSQSTIENFTDVRSLFPNISQIIIVSDDYHIIRSLLIAKHVGFQQISWSTPDESYLSFTNHLYYYLTDFEKLIYTLPYLLNI